MDYEKEYKQMKKIALMLFDKCAEYREQLDAKEEYEIELQNKYFEVLRKLKGVE